MKEVLNNLINSYHNESITTSVIFSVLLMVTILGLYEFLIYKVLANKKFYSKSFHVAIAVIPFFIAMIILCLQSNLVITLGTIGALAIIRFRTSLKDPGDMMYLLWSVFIGIICGCQLFEIGVLTSIVVTIVLFALERFVFHQKALLLMVRSSQDVEEELTQLLQERKIRYQYQTREHTDKGYDYAIEINDKNIQELSKELSQKENISKYTIMNF